MKQILLKLDSSGKIPEALLREIQDSKEEIELIFDAEEYEELFPIMQKLFNDISVMRIAQAKQRHQIKPILAARKEPVRIPTIAKPQEKRQEGKDRRQLPRWSVHKQAKILWSAKHEISPCVIEDLSLKGMCLSMPQPFPAEKSLKPILMLSDVIDLEIETQVTWRKQTTEGYFQGMSFSKIKDSDKDRIFQYINSNCSKQLKDQWWS